MSKIQKQYKKWKEWVVYLPKRTKLIVIGVAGFFLLMGIISLLLFIASQQKVDIEAGVTGSQKALRDAKVLQEKKEGAVRDDALKAIDSGDAAKANDVYSSAINSEEDPIKKIRLMLDQSEVLYNAGKYDEAIKVVKDADSLSEDKFLVASTLANYYEDRRMFKLAADNYTLAGKWAQSPTNEAHENKAYYDNQAKRVLILAGQQ